MRNSRFVFCILCSFVLLFTSCGSAPDTSTEAQSDVTVSSMSESKPGSSSNVDKTADEAAMLEAAAASAAEDADDIYTIENGEILLNGTPLDETVTSVLLSDLTTGKELLTDYPSVEFLSVEGENLTELSILLHFPNVKTLWVNHCLISDFSPISSLSSLEELSLTACTNLTDLSFLSGLNLIRLDISYCEHLADLSTLTELHNLKSLRLFEEWEIDDFSVLSTLTELEDLRLLGTNFDDLTLLQSLSHLETLRVGSAVADFSPLADGEYTLSAFQGTLDEETITWIRTLFPNCVVSVN